MVDPLFFWAAFWILNLVQAVLTAELGFTYAQAASAEELLAGVNADLAAEAL